MNIQCPQCGHRGVERLALTYGRGKSKTRANTYGLGVLIGLLNPLNWFGWINPLNWFSGVLVSFSHTRGTNTSILAKETKPPWRFPWVKAVVIAGLVLGGPLLLAVQGARHDVNPDTRFDAAVFVAVVVGSIAALAIIGIFYNRWVWAGRHLRWQRRFLCRRCGTMFEVENFDPNTKPGAILLRAPDHVTAQKKALEARRD